MFLLIDPTINVTETIDQAGEPADYFSFGGTYDATGTFSQGPPEDILNVNIAGLLNPQLIPLEVLQTQNPTPTSTLPGLKFICANPLPDNDCTQTNACGCTAADFAPIVAQDELANDSNQSEALSSIGSARFVYVTDEPLEGPQQSGTGPVSTQFGLSDSNISGYSTSNGTSYGVSYKHGWSVSGAGASLSVSSSNGFTFSNTQTAGTTNGQAHTATVTLGTSDVGCQEYVDVYEDTTYHTFAYALSEPPPSNCQ